MCEAQALASGVEKAQFRPDGTVSNHVSSPIPTSQVLSMLQDTDTQRLQLLKSHQGQHSFVSPLTESTDQLQESVRDIRRLQEGVRDARGELTSR